MILSRSNCTCWWNYSQIRWMLHLIWVTQWLSWLGWSSTWDLGAFCCLAILAHDIRKNVLGVLDTSAKWRLIILAVLHKRWYGLSHQVTSLEGWWVEHCCWDYDKTVDAINKEFTAPNPAWAGQASFPQVLEGDDFWIVLFFQCFVIWFLCIVAKWKNCRILEGQRQPFVMTKVLSCMIVIYFAFSFLLYT